MKLGKKVLLFLFASVLALSFVYMPTAAKASADNAPPVLVSFLVDENITGGDVTVKVTAKDESGIDTAKSWVGASTYDNIGPVVLQYKDDITTDAEKAAGKTTLEFAAKVYDNFNGEQQQYHISDIVLCDKAGNKIAYSDREGSKNLMEAKFFTVKAATANDGESPVVKSVSIDKTKINVGESVTFTLKITDKSKVLQGLLSFINPLGQVLSRNVRLSQVPGTTDTFTGKFTADADTMNGTYKLSTIDLNDTFLNYCYYHKLTKDEDDYSDGYKPMPDAWVKSFTVNNPATKTPKPPILKSVTLSSGKVKAGDPVHIKAVFNPNGTAINDIIYVDLKQPDGKGAGGYRLNRTGNTFEGYISIPADMQPGQYTLALKPVDFADYDLPYFTGCTVPKLTVESVFSGTEDTTIPVGGTFDPKAGVTAGNITQGSLTDKMEVTGSVDTSSPGIYLIRYRALSNQHDWSYGKKIYYDQSRFVCVTKATPDASFPGAPVAVTDGTLKTGAAASDVTVLKDGKKIAYAASYTAAGVYTFTTKIKLTDTWLEWPTFYKSATAVIDKTGPALSIGLSGTASGFKANVTAADPSGVKALKYLSGAQTADKVKANGKDILAARSFAAANGKYTVYAADGFGHESVKVFDVKFVPASSLKFKAKSASVITGATYQTTLSFSPGNVSYKGVKYASSNKSVATVDANGLVTAKKSGKAVITATALDGSKKTASMNITVKKPVITKITLNKTKVTLKGCGKTFKLKAAITPGDAANKAVLWASANCQIATVDANGLVMTKRVRGTVVITAYALDGSGKKASCTITFK